MSKFYDSDTLAGWTVIRHTRNGVRFNENMDTDLELLLNNWFITKHLRQLQIKECPFCGALDMFEDHDKTADNYIIGCHCGIRTDRFSTREQAIEAWNKRNE